MVCISNYTFSCEMIHMGSYECRFENEKGMDKTTCKVTVKPVRQ